MWVSALVRRVMAAGDFATVVHHGDDVAGSIVLLHRSRSGEVRVLQRVLDKSGAYSWKVSADGDSVVTWVRRQQRFDPDLWVIELDTPDLARFIDETTD